MKCLSCSRFKTHERCQLCTPLVASAEDDVAIEMPPLAPINEVEFPNVSCCYSCKRQSTDKYPLVLSLVCGTDLISRKFGPTTTSQNVLLFFVQCVFELCFSLPSTQPKSMNKFLLFILLRVTILKIKNCI